MFKCYDFKCNNQECQHIFDDLVNDDTNPTCPQCNSLTDRLLGNNTTNPPNPKLTELFIKFRKAENKYRNASKESRPRI